MKYELKYMQNCIYPYTFVPQSPVMEKLLELKAKLKPGEVYRREDLAHWSSAIDRHLGQLVREGALKKVAQGLYYVPTTTVFGQAPPEDATLVNAFLKDHRFLLTSPNAYNSLGVGTTQLYNQRVVYNHKRHGLITLGNRMFYFIKKPNFPQRATTEFLLVDLVNNLDSLAEDKQVVMENVKIKLLKMDPSRMKRALKRYGSVKTKKLLTPHLTDSD